MVRMSEITTKKTWDNFLNKIGDFDFYHTYDYHQISKSENDKAVLLIYEHDDVIIGLPMVIRSITGTPYYDVTSVYGYCGPISKNVTDKFDNSILIKNLTEYFRSKDIISIFSRLNPYVKSQSIVLNGYGEIVVGGKLVNIDVTIDKDMQRQSYQNRLKTHVNKSRRNCIVKRAETNKDILEFIDIYYESMNRVNASSYYYFNTDYFFNLYKSNNFNTDILLAIEKESSKIIAGSIFIKTNKIIQYHLSGTRSEYLHLMPNKLLIDEMRLIGTKENYKFFNLGGGLGGSNMDSLFKFKSSFSKDIKDFKLWKLIINQEIYDQLLKKNSLEKVNAISFFPLYRYSEK
ncbi:peptidoglycan bridge formation glycyltransferase FemA/FemB family protein [Aquimarina longa]|uniref:peptidoglycan bridge formation glycyltransferase FemA/FemB family protein n=1 Tax=Aquimarina longa TaxID=1080221 RepID=UPI0007837993|nr:peptidoglycan bridge formation glycyltransferase FemA/FemB family protein [Aquimarina longa]